MAIVWIDIWDTQNRSNTKKVINRQFNIGSYIAIVHDANMNLDARTAGSEVTWLEYVVFKGLSV